MEWRKINKLKELRIRKHKAQKDVADYANISTQCLQFYERDERIPPVDVAIGIAKYLGVNVYELWEARKEKKIRRRRK